MEMSKTKIELLCMIRLQDMKDFVVRTEKKIAELEAENKRNQPRINEDRMFRAWINNNDGELERLRRELSETKSRLREVLAQ